MNYDEARKKFHEYCNINYGQELYEWVEIDLGRPVASVREEAKAYLGKDLKIGNGLAADILEALHGCFIFAHDGLFFYNPNDFMAVVMMNLDH